MGEVESEGTVESERHSHMYSTHTHTLPPHMNAGLFAFREWCVILVIRNCACTVLQGTETPVNRVKISSA